MRSLFFPTFGHLATRYPVKLGVQQYSWSSPQQIDAIRRSALAHALDYAHVKVFRRPLQLAVPAMIAYGAKQILARVVQEKWDTLMPRSIIPAAMCLLALKRRPDLRLVYDADGFMADERVDFAGWSPHGLSYRLFRDWEAEATRKAEAVITRSTRAEAILAARAGSGSLAGKIHVIPNAKDAASFKPIEASAREAIRARYGIPPDAPLLVYAGSLGPQYNPEAMLELFELVHAKRPDARLLVLSAMGHVIKPILPEALAPSVHLSLCAPDEVAAHLASADLGLSLREPTFSQQGVCPIKVVEYTLCGLPTVMIRGVGDLDERFQDTPGLFTIEDTSQSELKRCAAWFVDRALKARRPLEAALRAAALEHFSLERASRSLAMALDLDRPIPQQSDGSEQGA